MSDPAADAVLTVGIVVYRSDLALLRRCLERLADAVRAIAPAPVSVTVIDNGPDDASPALAAMLADLQRTALPYRIDRLSGHGNVGYGRGNNLAIERSAARWHLILNPDAELEPDALHRGLVRLEADASIGLVAATTRGDDGLDQRLVKRRPSVLVLVMRATGWPFFRDRVAAYDVAPGSGEVIDVTGACVSGSFMLCRGATLKAIGGFDPRYFLYFEDFDLSLRMSRVARLVWDRRVVVIHHGGDAAGKGLRHVLLFGASALRFFSTHGWRLL